MSVSLSLNDRLVAADAWDSPDRSRAVAAWLLVVAALVLAMVVVGGATRLTGSGLSITQWRPIAGAIPPLDHADWARAFGLYRATPQYQLVNRAMTLEQFRFIFWWEWSHRFLGRLLGLVFLAPFLALLALRRVPRRLIWRCAGLFVLGGLQGLVGWLMVRSGLEDRTSVAPEALAAHLGTALILFVALVWTALEAVAGPSPKRALSSRRWAWASAVFAAAVYLQCVAGALVAGNRAGLVDADWPLMGGRLIPQGYWQSSPWRTLLGAPPAVQFNHRLLAYGLLAGAIGLAVAAVRSCALTAWTLRAAFAVAGLTVMQATLGVATLWTQVSLWVALAHQANAVLLLACAVSLAWLSRRPVTVLGYRTP